jgi:drug/metabolite transporter (DMT)-like permease
VSKKGVEAMPALQLSGLRQLIASILFLGFFWVRKWPIPTRKDWPTIIVLAIINFTLSNGLSTWGVKYISSGLGCIIGAIYPLWLVIYALIAEKKPPPRISLIGLVLGFMGICIIFYDFLSDFIKPIFTFGIVLSILSTWSWAAGTIITREQAKNFNPYVSLGYQMGISSLILLTYSLLSGHWTPIAKIPYISWFAIFYLVIFGSIVAFVCFLFSLQHLSTEQASIYAYINPIIALIIGSLLGNEPLTQTLLVGAIITLLGVYFVHHGYKKSEESH